MSAYRKIGSALSEGIATNPLFLSIAKLDTLLIGIPLAYQLLESMKILSLGGFLGNILSAVMPFVLYLGLAAAWANKKDLFLYGGLFGLAAVNLVYVIFHIFGQYGFFSWYSLAEALVYGALGYWAYETSRKAVD